MSDTTGETSEQQHPVPAATVIVFRRDPQGGPAQLLLVERSGTMAFAGGATVFPGGRVDEADRLLAARIGNAFAIEADDLAARIAGVRETLEETGLVIGIKGVVDADRARLARKALLADGALGPVLEAFGWTLDIGSLVPFARWLPSHRPVRAFDTRFYLADLGTGDVDVAVDATENRHLFWASAADALRLAREGAIKVIFPTRRNLERLAQFEDFESCRRHAEGTPLVTISPWEELRDGARWLVIPQGIGYPVDGEPLSSALRG